MDEWKPKKWESVFCWLNFFFGNRREYLCVLIVFGTMWKEGGKIWGWGEKKRRAEGSISFNQIFIYLLELRTLRNIKTNRIACDLCFPFLFSFYTHNCFVCIHTVFCCGLLIFLVKARLWSMKQWLQFLLKNWILRRRLVLNN